VDPDSIYIIVCNFFQADRLAAGLLQLGLKPGDRVGIWGPNSSDWYISRVGTARAGLIAVSTNILQFKYRRGHSERGSMNLVGFRCSDMWTWPSQEVKLLY
jgi:acyl-CoA synthetase (AMP-forming)/AMP-acid ligase II